MLFPFRCSCARRARAKDDRPKVGRLAHARGFSMIELLVVIILIGILAALAIPSMMEQTIDRHVYSDALAINDLIREARTHRDRSRRCGDARDDHGGRNAGHIHGVRSGATEPAAGGQNSVPLSSCKAPTNWALSDSSSGAAQSASQFRQVQFGPYETSYGICDANFLDVERNSVDHADRVFVLHAARSHVCRRRRRHHGGHVRECGPDDRDLADRGRAALGRERRRHRALGPDSTERRHATLVGGDGGAMRSLAKKAGFTAIEVMLALTLLAIGTAGVIAMEQASIDGNYDARRLDVANSIMRLWIERLRRDGTLWTMPNPENPLTNNRANALLIATVDPDPTNATWRLPTAREGDTAPLQPLMPQFDLLGRDILSSDTTTPVMFCVHTRLSWLVNEDLMRAEVRVFWPKGSQSMGNDCTSDPPGGLGDASRHDHRNTTSCTGSRRSEGIRRHEPRGAKASRDDSGLHAHRAPRVARRGPHRRARSRSALSRDSTRTFYEEQRAASAEMSLRLAIDRLRQDVQRASFMSSGNVLADTFVPSSAKTVDKIPSGSPAALQNLAGNPARFAGIESRHAALVDGRKQLRRRRDLPHGQFHHHRSVSGAERHRRHVVRRPIVQHRDHVGGLVPRAH